jgi:hypothetical protein
MYRLVLTAGGGGTHTTVIAMIIHTRTPVSRLVNAIPLLSAEMGLPTTNVIYERVYFF